MIVKRHATKQCLARKTIDLLMVYHNIEVIDANYNPTKLKFAALLCTLERESYIIVKKWVVGIQEPIKPS